MKDLHTNSTGIDPTDWPVNTPKHDFKLRGALAQALHGTAPVSTLAMMTDWALHYACAPDKHLSLAHLAFQNWLDLTRFVAKGCPKDAAAKPVSPSKHDRRFRHEDWDIAPFSAWSQAFLLAEAYVETATSDVPGLDPEHSKAMSFLARQMMDAVAPSNFLVTNPEALARTIETKGQNLKRGASAFMADMAGQLTGAGNHTRPSRVGHDVAVSPGKVVMRNHLMELIQYAPTTDTVHPEPLLIVPAWIMKYYILDLSPHNSLVRFLTDQGFTVFMISWRNPGAEDADLAMQDYLTQGPLAAIDHITRETGAPKVHGVGYCLGGTLLSICAATLARAKDGRLASMTLFAAQTDFSEAGELMLFVNESQVSFLEDMMQLQGYLDSSQMMSAFQMMRSNDLIWSHMIRAYLLGEDDAPMNDLMAWNADGTRMPARMHSQYLRQMFLRNELATGRYHVDGHPVSLRDIRVPIFAVGTETDHIAPWQSVYKIHDLTHADVTFALTNGGHNAGVVSQPGHKHRHHRLHTKRDQDPSLTPETWLETASLHNGSWWPAWSAWLARQMSERVSPPEMAGALCDAPGTYVMME